VRLFVAQAGPEAVSRRHRLLIRELKPLDNSWKWVRTDKPARDAQFYGEVAPDKLEGIVRALRSVALRVQWCEILRRGIFSNERRPRVFWVGMNAPANLLDGGTH